MTEHRETGKKKSMGVWIACGVIAAAVIFAVLLAVLGGGGAGQGGPADSGAETSGRGEADKTPVDLFECCKAFAIEKGESFRLATGYIDPAVFSDSYPISCDSYQGSASGQTEFMEQSRVGMCDLIACLKRFVVAENMPCDFSDFEFVHFQ